MKKELTKTDKMWRRAGFLMIGILILEIVIIFILCAFTFVLLSIGRKSPWTFKEYIERVWIDLIPILPTFIMIIGCFLRKKFTAILGTIISCFILVVSIYYVLRAVIHNNIIIIYQLPVLFFSVFSAITFIKLDILIFKKEKDNS